MWASITTRHMYAALLDDPTLEPPFVTLIVSGGHTLLIAMDDHGGTGPRSDSRRHGRRGVRQGRSLPRTQLSVVGDRSAGDRRQSRRDRVPAPDARRRQRLLVLRAQDGGRAVRAQASRVEVADVAASFQAAVVDVLVTGLLRVAGQTGITSTIVIGGGVAANTEPCARLLDEAETSGFAWCCPASPVHRQRGDGRVGRLVALGRRRPDPPRRRGVPGVENPIGRAASPVFSVSSELVAAPGAHWSGGVRSL